MKNKLLVVCLAAILIAGSCAESKPMGESSEAKESSIILVDSQPVESNEESKVESVADVLDMSEDLDTSETSEISIDVSEYSEETHPEENSNVIVEEISKEKIPETHEAKLERSTIPNDQVVIRYNPPTSSDDEKWASEMNGTEDPEEEIQIWAITEQECVTCDGNVIAPDTYIHILWNDIDDDYCVIQWYDSEANLLDQGLHMFEIFESDTHTIIANEKTAGIVMP